MYEFDFVTMYQTDLEKSQAQSLVDDHRNDRLRSLGNNDECIDNKEWITIHLNT